MHCKHTLSTHQHCFNAILSATFYQPHQSLCCQPALIKHACAHTYTATSPPKWFWCRICGMPRLSDGEGCGDIGNFAGCGVGGCSCFCCGEGIRLRSASLTADACIGSLWSSRFTGEFNRCSSIAKSRKKRSKRHAKAATPVALLALVRINCCFAKIIFHFQFCEGVIKRPS